jgi:hypothetical protein
MTHEEVQGSSAGRRPAVNNTESVPACGRFRSDEFGLMATFVMDLHVV